MLFTHPVHITMAYYQIHRKHNFCQISSIEPRTNATKYIIIIIFLMFLNYLIIFVCKKVKDRIVMYLRTFVIPMENQGKWQCNSGHPM